MAERYLTLNLDNRSPIVFDLLQRLINPSQLSNWDRQKLRARLISSRRKVSFGGTNHTRRLIDNESKLRSKLASDTSLSDTSTSFRNTPLYSKDPPPDDPVVSKEGESAFAAFDDKKGLSNLPYSQFTWDDPTLDLMADIESQVVTRPSINASRNKKSLQSSDLLLFKGSINSASAVVFVDGGASGTPEYQTREMVNIATGFAGEGWLNDSPISNQPESLADLHREYPDIYPAPFDVSVATGHSMNCNRILRNVRLKIGGYSERIDLYVLPMTSFDVVLGKQWLNLRRPYVEYATNTIHLCRKIFHHIPKGSSDIREVDRAIRHDRLYTLKPLNPAAPRAIDRFPDLCPTPILSSLQSPKATYNELFPPPVEEDSRFDQSASCNPMVVEDEGDSELMTKKAFMRYLRKAPKSERRYFCAIIRPLGEVVDLPTHDSNPEDESVFDPPDWVNDFSSDKEVLKARPPKHDFELQVYKEFEDRFPPELPPNPSTHNVNPPMIIQTEGHEHETPCRPVIKLNALELEELKKQIDKYVEKGFIRPSQSSYGSAVFFVPKKNGKLRMVIDYRPINSITRKDKYPLPNIETILEQLQGSRYFSSLDLAQGYHQLAMCEEDIPKTAFRSQFGSYEWTVMGFGLTNAVPTFVRHMNKILAPYLGKFCMCFIDDIIIFSRTIEEHREHCRLILQALRDNHIYANWEKCDFLAKKVEYCGIDITREGVNPSDAKVKAVKDWEVPTTVYNVRSFLGAVGYYRKFIGDFAKIAKPLTELTKEKPGRESATATNVTLSKGGRTQKTFSIKGEWTEDHQKSFETLKSKLVSAPILRLPNPSLPYEIMSDASKYAVGAVLMQKYDDGVHPVAFFSKQMNSAEQRYPVHEQELLAIFLALKHWRHLLIGNHATIYTDHKPLTHYKTQATLSSRQIRWLSFFADYDVDIIAVPGTKNVVADALSRIGYDPQHTGEQLDDLRVQFLKKVHTMGSESDYPLTDSPSISSIYSLPRLNGISYNQISSVTPFSLLNKLLDDRFEDDNELFPGAAVSFFMNFYQQEGTPTTTTSSATPESLREAVFNIRESLLSGYGDDYIAQLVIAKKPAAASYRLVDDLILYYDSAGEARVYIPSTSRCSLGVLATEHPIEGEVVRTECSLREEIIRDVHTSHGHVGKGKTLELLHRHFYWPGMSKDVYSYVKGCRECQQNKAITHRKYGLLTPSELPTRRWAFVGMDFIMDLPRTVRGSNAIYVVVDYYSKRAHFIPCKTSVTAGQTAQLFYDNIYKHHGMPLKIISDRDTRFTSDVWRSLFEKLHTRLAMSSPYKASTDGLVERTNRVLEEMLRAFTENKHRNWDQFLTAAEFAYNNTVNTSTGYTPFFLDTGQHPLDPHAHAFAPSADSISGDLDQRNYATSTNAIMAEWEDALSFAHSALMDAQESYARYANRFRQDKVYKEGDQVWLDTKHVSVVNADGKFTKRTTFDKRRYGPYTIKKVLVKGDGSATGAYELDLPANQRFHPVQPVSRLEPVKESDVFPDAHSSPPPLPVVTQEGVSEFEVDCIIADRKGRGGRKEYFVKFLGYGDDRNEWLTIAQLRNSPEIIADYESSRAGILSSLLSFLPP